MIEQQELSSDSSDTFIGNVLFPSASKPYLVKLVTVACLSVLTLVLYAGVVSFAVYHLISILIRFIPAFGDSANSFYICGYILVLVLFSVISLCLFRPFFRRKNIAVSVELTKEQQGPIYEFANKVAAAFEVSGLERIVINNDVVVDVGFESLRDFYRGRLTLNIGLPLIPIISKREFCSLLAHELSHYRLTKVRRAYSVIRYLRGWLYRISHNHDGWYEGLEVVAEKVGMFRFICVPGFVVLGLTNRIFQIFLAWTEWLTDSAVNESAYYADQVQANIMGSESFDQLLKHLVRIDQAYQLAIEETLRASEAPENLAEAISKAYEKNAIQANQFIEMERSELYNSWHLLPAPNKRTKRIKKFTIEPIFSDDESLASLFIDVEAVGVAVSARFYEINDIVGDLKKSDKTNFDRKGAIALPDEEAMLKRFTSGLYRRDIAWEFPQADKFSSLPSEKIIPFSNKLVGSIRRSLPELTRYMELLDDYDRQQSRLHYAQWLIKDGSKNRPGADELDELKFNKKEFERKYLGKKELYRKSYGVRVAAAVAMGKTSKAYGSAVKLIQLLLRLGGLQDSISEAKVKCSTLEKLIIRRTAGDDIHQKTISRLTRMMLKVVEDLEIVLVRMPINLVPKGAEIREGRLDLDQLNGEDYEIIVSDRFFELVRYYEAFNTAISAKLAQFVEMVERRQGIESVVVAVVKPILTKAS